MRMCVQRVMINLFMTLVFGVVGLYAQNVNSTLVPLSETPASSVFFDLQGQSLTVSSTPSEEFPTNGSSIMVTLQFDLNSMNAPDTLLGSFSASLQWDPAVLTYSSNNGIGSGFSGFVNTTDASAGSIIFNGASAQGVGGVFDVLQLTFDVNGTRGETTLLQLSFGAMAAAITFTDLLPWLTIEPGSVTVDEPTGVDLTGAELPTEFALLQNYPNPFNPTTNFKFRIAEPGLVSLQIFDTGGRCVKTILNNSFQPGVYQAQWDGKDDGGQHVSSGVYFYQLNVENGFRYTKRMLLLK